MLRQALHSTRCWQILATLVVAHLMVVLDATVVNIAQPFAHYDCGFASNDRQWTITASSITWLGRLVCDSYQASSAGMTSRPNMASTSGSWASGRFTMTCWTPSSACSRQRATISPPVIRPAASRTSIRLVRSISS